MTEPLYPERADGLPATKRWARGRWETWNGLEWRPARLPELGPFTATVHVEADGTLFARCSCGELDEQGHPDTGGETRALGRLKAHVQLHATAAARRVPWSDVLKQSARLAYRTGQRSRPTSRRDDDPGL